MPALHDYHKYKSLSDKQKKWLKQAAYIKATQNAANTMALSPTMVDHVRHNDLAINQPDKDELRERKNEISLSYNIYDKHIKAPEPEEVNYIDKNGMYFDEDGDITADTLPSWLKFAPESAIGAITNRKIAEYNSVYRPFNRAVIDSINSDVYTDQAKASVSGDAKQRMLSNSEEIAKRNAGRFGVQRTAREVAQGRKLAELSYGQHEANTINQARKADYDRKVRLTDAMINVGRGMSADSSKNLSAAADAAMTIDNQNASIDAANSANRTQAVGSAISTAAMMIMAFA